VVWWNSDEPATAAHGFAAATANQYIDVNLDSLYIAGQLKGQQIFWTVLVVHLSPYARLTQPAESERSTFFYNAPGGPAPQPPPSGPTAPPPIK
jgi:hypothetical protein